MGVFGVESEQPPTMETANAPTRIMTRDLMQGCPWFCPIRPLLGGWDCGSEINRSSQLRCPGAWKWRE
jgi:hypothetical protein